MTNERLTSTHNREELGEIKKALLSIQTSSKVKDDYVESIRNTQE